MVENQIVRSEKYGVGFVRSICCGGAKVVIKFMPHGILEKSNGVVSMNAYVAEHSLKIIGRIKKIKK